MNQRFLGNENKLKRILESMGFEVARDYSISGNIVSIFLPQEKVGFEFDGPMHFRKRDAGRDKRILEESGIKIMRITEKDLHDKDLQENILEWMSE